MSQDGATHRSGSATCTPSLRSRITVADDRYEIVQQLGRGHFGAVFLARHTVLDRECALKLIPARSNDVLAEARLLASIPEHDNVVKVLDAGDWDGRTV